MKTIIILFLLILTMCPSFAEPVAVNSVSTMEELLIAINNISIIEVSDGYYTVYEPINIATTTFTITQDTRIDTYAFIDFNSSVEAHNKTIIGFESGRKRRNDNRYIESGYIIVRENLTMDDVHVRGLGSEYRAARYNNGISVYGNSNVTNSVFEYVKRIAIISEDMRVYLPYSGGYINKHRDTMNTFDGNKFKYTDTTIHNSVNVHFVDCEFTNSKIQAHNYNNKNDPCGIYTESCTFTDTDDRRDGDGHYSGMHGYWANMFISDSSFIDCDIRAGDRPAIIENCTLVDGNIVLSSAALSTVTKTHIHNGSIIVFGRSDGIVITKTGVGGDFYGIRIGSHTKYGTTSISAMEIHSNNITNTSCGISIQNAYGSVYRAKIHNNHIYNSTMSIHACGGTAHSDQRNMIYNNILCADVIISDGKNAFHDNDVTGTIFIENVPSDFTMRNNTANEINITDSVNILIDSCSIQMYNLLNYSNSNWIVSDHKVNTTTDTTIDNLSVSNTSYRFNGSTRMTHNNMDMTVHNGNLSEINASGLNGTYDLRKESVVIIGNVSSVSGRVVFGGNFSKGNYSITKTQIEAQESQLFDDKSVNTKKSKVNGRKAQLIVPPSNDTTINEIRENTTIVEYTEKNETSVTTQNKNEKTVSIFQHILNWILNLFK